MQVSLEALYRVLSTGPQQNAFNQSEQRNMTLLLSEGEHLVCKVEAVFSQC